MGLFIAIKDEILSLICHLNQKSEDLRTAPVSPRTHHLQRARILPSPPRPTIHTRLTPPRRARVTVGAEYRIGSQPQLAGGPGH